MLQALLALAFAATSSAAPVRIHKASAGWTPVGVKAGGGSARTAFSDRLKKRKVKGKKAAFTGKSSPAKAVARLYRAGEDRRLIVSVFPKSLEKERAHVELRFLIIEGYLEKLEVAEVTASAGAGALDDSAMLQAKGLQYQEEFPSEGSLKVSALDPRPGKGSRNAGSLKGAVFPEWLSESAATPGLGRVDLDYSTSGVTAAP